MLKRIIAFILVLATFISLVPVSSVVATSTTASSAPYVNYGAVIGNTAVFNTERNVAFLVHNDPQNFDYDADWDNDKYWLYYDDVDEIFDFDENHLFTVTNYYYDKDTADLWYKVKAAPGYELPERMSEYQWVYVNNTDYYEYEDWEEYSPDLLIVSNYGKNFIFDKDGNPVNTVEIGLYDKFELTCKTSLLGSVEYQWQIRIGDEWVDIMGEDTATIPADYSLLANALDTYDRAQLRCVTDSGSKTVTGEPITVTVDTDFDYDNYVHPEEIPPSISERSVNLALADGDKSDVCYVTVQYLFENGTQAANSFVAEVPLNVETALNVTFPYVQGYLPYYEGVQKNDFSLTDVFTGNQVYTVTYIPTEVNYTVDVYFQNVEDDDYSFYDSVTYKGLTGTKVPLNTGTFPGMRELLHETPTIAADGSTHVEVYYDRIYYMTRVYLDGGYGIYSVYARYGADLQSHLTAPDRPGYSFVGWDEYTVDNDDDGVPESGGDKIADTVYPTVPAKNLAYVALWVENSTAQVNVVFWGQNPNDDGYSYLSTEKLHVKPGTELTYALNGSYVCGLEEHTHGSGCTTKCGKEVHSHTAGCYTLSCPLELHTHGKGCYNNVGNTATPWGAPNNPQNGQIYTRSSWGTTYRYIYIYGIWYSYNDTAANGAIISPSCGKDEHTHTDYTGSCYTLTCTKEVHAHEGTCYTCVAHTHKPETCGYPTFDGYDKNLWTLSTNPEHKETITVERDGSSVLNVYFDRTKFKIDFRTSTNGNIIYTIEEKWGANLSSHWPIKGTNGRTYNKGERWEPSGSSTYNQVLVYIAIMPQESFYLVLSDVSNRDTFIMHYMGEVLPGQEATGTRVYNGKTFKELFTPVSAKYNHLTKAEDFLVLEGYNQYASDPTFGSNGQLDINGGGDVYMYYTRKSYSLEFHSGNDTVRTEVSDYEQPLNIYADYTNPPLPSNVEKDSHEFAGWYLNPECTRPADLSTMTMPAGNLALYAKWVPKYHEVRIVLEKKADGNYGPEDSVLESGGNKVESLEVLHGTIVFSGNDAKTPPTPDNGLYKFLGWFYEDDGVELMWDFEHHPVVKDTVIYAKWSSEVMVPYTIYYRDQNGNNIAEPTVSSSLAGHSLTVKAKVGNELYLGYQSGYFPKVVSHSIELKTEDAEDGVVYIFEYQQAEAIEYTIHYIDKDTGNEMGSETKSSTFAVVTETFKSFADVPAYKDHVPDAYQKTLVLTSDPTQNNIYFYYTKAEQNGVWYVEHLVQNVSNPEQYDPRPGEGGVTQIGTVITPSWPVDISTDGYKFKEAIINDGTTTKTVTSWNEVKGEVTKAGLHIQIKYDRIKYPYKIVYINKDTGNEIRDPDIFIQDGNMKMYGSTASIEGHTLPSISGYVYESSTTCTIVKDEPSNITKNIIYVYYTEQSIKIDFKVVGEVGGTVTPEYTHVKFETDTGATSKATPAKGYKFVGWYLDEECTYQVSASEMLTLIKPDGGWVPITYYAKFEKSLANLTIKRENVTEDAKQVFVYEIENTETGNKIYVTITGNGSVTVSDLDLGKYTITQQKGWSWRYDDAEYSLDFAADTTVTFDGGASTKWLNGHSSVKVNEYNEG